MPTLTFYADEETALMLDELLEEKSRLAGFKVSSGKFITAHIKDEHKRLCKPRVSTEPTQPVEVKRRTTRKANSPAAPVVAAL